MKKVKKKYMKLRFLILISILLGAYNAKGQQDVLFTQFMYNKLGLNPAYAGNNDYASILGIVRNQWAGFEGAPQAQVLSFNSGSIGKIGLGLNMSRHTIGVTEKLTAEGIYAYRFPFQGGNLSMGLSVSGRWYKSDFSKPGLTIIDPFEEDPAIDKGIYKTQVFNVGFGVYYNLNRFYFGASVPRLFRADIDFKPGETKSYEVRHVYVMGGGALDLNPKIVFMPQILIRWAENSPFDIDLNMGLLFNDRLYTAITARTGGTTKSWFESIDALVGFHINRNIFLAAAYDFTTSELRKYESGSLEVLLQYNFGNYQKPIDVINPRFF